MTDWIAKMVAFLIVFAVVGVLGSWVFANGQVGFLLGLVGAGAFAGVALKMTGR